MEVGACGALGRTNVDDHQPFHQTGLKTETQAQKASVTGLKDTDNLFRH